MIHVKRGLAARLSVGVPQPVFVGHPGNGFPWPFYGARYLDGVEATGRRVDPTALGVALRAGVHTGEIERRGDDVGGLAVHVAARVQSLAGAGEIMVSAVIPALTSGSGTSGMPCVSSHLAPGMDSPVP